jgi:hypothetical protein
MKQIYNIKSSFRLLEFFLNFIVEVNKLVKLTPSEHGIQVSIATTNGVKFCALLLPATALAHRTLPKANEVAHCTQRVKLIFPKHWENNSNVY